MQRTGDRLVLHRTFGSIVAPVISPHGSSRRGTLFVAAAAVASLCGVSTGTTGAGNALADPDPGPLCVQKLAAQLSSEFPSVETSDNAATGTPLMEDRGSATQNYLDHVHIRVGEFRC